MQNSGAGMSSSKPPSDAPAGTDLRSVFGPAPKKDTLVLAAALPVIHICERFNVSLTARLSFSLRRKLRKAATRRKLVDQRSLRLQHRLLALRVLRLRFRSSHSPQWLSNLSPTLCLAQRLRSGDLWQVLTSSGAAAIPRIVLLGWCTIPILARKAA